ncbi:hypothetical protein [Nonomuraea longispora]|uniref:hypothetical protein n=1 Tax=Nonomuraea longispora TaxID=1848320 RepID=UPI001FEA1A24|nr:hypothetical protein [Nonomuraea longispora]
MLLGGQVEYAHDLTSATARQHGSRARFVHSPRSDGAEPFWKSVADVVHDDRDGDPGRIPTVHYEIPLRLPARR